MSTKAPFPYFGGKSLIAAEVWDRLGDVDNYVEPFFGSGAVLLSRPSEPHIETVNDADGFIANFWRAVQHDPEQTAHWADWPVNEIDLHARHLWLLKASEGLAERLIVDPDYYNAKIAGWWCWGMCCWIGSGFCSGDGAWQVIGGEFRQRPHLGDPGQGIHRKRPHLGNAGQGIHRQRPHLRNAGRGDAILDWFQTLADRLRRVRICCGDWSRVCGPTPTVKLGMTGVFLDPPYSFDEREVGLYRHDTDVAAEVREWALANGDDTRIRIALCGYEGEHDMPVTWERLAWKARGGYGSQGEARGRENASREVLWFSPHCLKPDRPRALELFT